MESNNLPSNEGFSSPFTPNPSQNFHFSNLVSNSPGSRRFPRASDLLMAVSVCSEASRTRITELANAAMEELTRAAFDGDSSLGNLQQNETYYTLMDIMKMVEVGESELNLLDVEIGPPQPFTEHNGKNILEDPHQDLETEVSKETGFVKMDALGIVGLLMDLKQWSVVFSSIVSRAAVLQVLSSMGLGDQNYHGTLQVMTAEFNMGTPLVPSRESYFARYCKQLAAGTWGVVDVALEDIFPYPSIRFLRKPSGCIIQAAPNGFSKVMWVEHVAADNRWVHRLFRPSVNARLAFGAKRWVSALVRYCKRLGVCMPHSRPPANGVFLALGRRISLLKLSERMMRSFHILVSASTENPWLQVPIHGAHDMRVMTKRSEDDPGKPPCPSVIGATSLPIPATQKGVFDYLRHEKSRNKWDILSYGYSIEELASIILGDDSRNRLSIFQVKSTPKRVEIFYLQESFFDESGSYVVYAPIDIPTMNMVFNGGNPDNVAILSSGFAVFRDGPRLHEPEGETDGSILTIALNIIDHTITEFIPFESVESMHRIIIETVTSIREGVTARKRFW